MHLKYKSPDGKTFKSAKDVKKHLRDSRQFSQVAVSVPETDEEPGTRKNKEPRKADEDPDFQPPAPKSAKKACGKGGLQVSVFIHDYKVLLFKYASNFIS